MKDSNNLTVQESIVWDKVIMSVKNNSFTHLFYIWEQMEHKTKKIVGAKGNYPHLQSKIIATKLNPLSFKKLVDNFNKTKN